MTIVQKADQEREEYLRVAWVSEAEIGRNASVPRSSLKQFLNNLDLDLLEFQNTVIHGISWTVYAYVLAPQNSLSEFAIISLHLNGLVFIQLKKTPQNPTKSVLKWHQCFSYEQSNTLGTQFN